MFVVIQGVVGFLLAVCVHLWVGVFLIYVSVWYVALHFYFFVVLSSSDWAGTQEERGNCAANA